MPCRRTIPHPRHRHRPASTRRGQNHPARHSAPTSATLPSPEPHQGHTRKNPHTTPHPAPRRCRARTRRPTKSPGARSAPRPAIPPSPQPHRGHTRTNPHTTPHPAPRHRHANKRRPTRSPASRSAPTSAIPPSPEPHRGHTRKNPHTTPHPAPRRRHANRRRRRGPLHRARRRLQRSRRPRNLTGTVPGRAVVPGLLQAAVTPPPVDALRRAVLLRARRRRQRPPGSGDLRGSLPSRPGKGKLPQPAVGTTEEDIRLAGVLRRPERAVISGARRGRGCARRRTRQHKSHRPYHDQTRSPRRNAPRRQRGQHSVHAPFIASPSWPQPGRRPALLQTAETSSSSLTVNEDPQPHAAITLGFSTLKPAPWRPSTKSMIEPFT